VKIDSQKYLTAKHFLFYVMNMFRFFIFTVMLALSSCGGDGTVDGRCGECGGGGKFLGFFNCRTCDGDGDGTVVCPTCDGEGGDCTTCDD